MKTIVSTSVVLLAILSVSLLGCERIDPMIPPDTTSQMGTTLKIGVIQPEYSYTTFSQGAETARVQINESGGVLGMQVEFISQRVVITSLWRVNLQHRRQVLTLQMN